MKLCSYNADLDLICFQFKQNIDLFGEIRTGDPVGHTFTRTEPHDVWNNHPINAIKDHNIPSVLIKLPYMVI